MTTSHHHLLLPEGLEDQAVLTALAGLDAVGAVVDDLSAITAKQIYLDTFDWRLHRRDRTLHLEPDGDEGRLVWSARASGRALVSMPASGQPPVWGPDLPEGAIRRAVVPMLDVRALRPVVTFEGVFRPVLLCDPLGEIVVRVIFDRLHARSLAGVKQRLRVEVPRGIRLEVIPGGEGVGEAALEALVALGLMPCASALDRAYTAIGVIPAGWSTRLDFPLEPTSRSDDAVKQIMLHLLKVIEVNGVGVQQNIDIKCLHDLRVATRRTRSGLSRMKGVLPEKTVLWAKEEFAWLQHVTGPARDLDVFACELPRMTADLPLGLQSGVAPLAALIDEHRVAENAKVHAAVRSDRFAELVARWRKAMEKKAPKKPKAPDALTPIAELASVRIWKMYRRVLKEGRLITVDSPVEQMHELRKTVKKLRYLLEFFRHLYPRKQMSKCVKALKQLQTLLGHLNDAQVQHDFMLALGGSLKSNGQVPPESLMLAGVLMARALEALEAGRLRFQARFEAFDTPEHYALFEALFR
ncbi:MAG: CHAD domain-containing protein [Bradymonadia bacterium]